MSKSKSWRGSDASNRKIYPGDAMMYARLAINILDNIQPTDTERIKALLSVVSYIEKQAHKGTP